MNDLENKKVAILGIGIEGVALYDYLIQKNCDITICDQNGREVILEKSPADLKDHIEEILGKSKVSLGVDYLNDLGQYDVVFRSPGINYLTREIQDAREKGVVISSQIKLFFDLCPAKIVGVTGTKGKGTTASLISEILKKKFEIRSPKIELNSNLKIDQIQNLSDLDISASDSRNVYIAGNIGYPAITLLDKIKPEDIVVLELSSFQLQDLEKSPSIAVFTNLGVDHMDNHQTIEEYHESKFNIFKYQQEIDTAIINADSTFPQEKIGEIKAKRLFFSKTQKSDAFVEKNNNDWAVFLANSHKIVDLSEVKLIGKHNLENIAAATLAAIELGVGIETIREAVKEFNGLPHRLEFVRELDGITFVNDSFATNPDPTMAAINSFDSPKVLILGGSSKGADFSEMAKLITEKNVKAVVAIGVEGKKIKEALLSVNYSGQIIDGGTNIGEIVAQSKEVASSGDIVIFSPACASFDMFKNYKDRGEKFKAAVAQL